MTRGIRVKGYTCGGCGKDEVVFWESAYCGECWEKQSREDVAALIALGYPCKCCLELPWWRVLDLVRKPGVPGFATPAVL